MLRSISQTSPASRSRRPSLRLLRFATVPWLCFTAAAAFAVPAELPDLVGLLAPAPEGSWIKVNQNNFQDVWTPAELRPLRSSSNPAPYAILGPWSSFTWDTNRGDLLLYGGGHGNYAGNDVYRWRGSTGLWERASLPSENTIVNKLHYIPIDSAMNAPQSAHTYDNTIFLPNLDRMLTFGGASTNSGNHYYLQTGPTTVRRTGPYLFDPARADGNKVGGTTGSHVQRVAPHPEIVGGEMWMNRDLFGRPVVTPGNFVHGTTGYAIEDGRDVVYVSAGNNLFKYTIVDLADPASDTWEIVGRRWTGCCTNGAGAYDPVNNVFVRTGYPQPSAPFAYWDLDQAGPNNKNLLAYPIDLSGGFVMDKSYGMDYDPLRGEMLLWKGGTDVWALDYDDDLTDWRIEKRASTSVTGPPMPAVISGGGVLGKWKYIPNLDAFIALEDKFLGNIWLYKPFDWVDPLLTPPDLALMYGYEPHQPAAASLQFVAAAFAAPEPNAGALVTAALALMLGSRVRRPSPRRWKASS